MCDENFFHIYKESFFLRVEKNWSKTDGFATTAAMVAAASAISGFQAHRQKTVDGGKQLSLAERLNDD